MTGAGGGVVDLGSSPRVWQGGVSEWRIGGGAWPGSADAGGKRGEEVR